jgi:hypothetical protein
VKTSLRIFLLLNHGKKFSLKRDSQALNKSQQEAFLVLLEQRQNSSNQESPVTFAMFFFFWGIEVTQNSISCASNNKQS